MAEVTEMIDVELRARAKPRSDVIYQIERSWRDALYAVKDLSFQLPFEGEYICKIKNMQVYVEGYRGRMVIDKITNGSTTFRLITPIVCPEWVVYGKFDNRGKLRCFNSEPIIGVHYLGIDISGQPAICTGDINISNIKSLDKFREVCHQIVRSWEVINSSSLGKLHLPGEFAGLQNILENSSDITSTLHYKGMIQNII